MSPVDIVSNAIRAAFLYLYPSYLTFKVLARRPGTDDTVEKWLTYWCVAGAFAAFETSLEWVVSWFPFYSELKTLLLLFLAVQGTAGVAVVYKSYLEPQYIRYEPQIDAHIAQLSTRTTVYIQQQLQKVYTFVLGSVGAAQNNPPPHPPPNAGASADSSLNLGSLATGAWNTYGQGMLRQVGAMVGGSGAGTGGASASGVAPAGTPSAEIPRRPSPPRGSPARGGPPSYTSSVDSRGPQFPVPYGRSVSGGSQNSRNTEGYNI